MQIISSSCRTRRTCFAKWPISSRSYHKWEHNIHRRTRSTKHFSTRAGGLKPNLIVVSLDGTHSDGSNYEYDVWKNSLTKARERESNGLAAAWRLLYLFVFRSEPIILGD